MMQRIPIIPTILVIAAAGVMVWLGFWQLGRSEEKAAMIAAYSNVSDAPPVTEADLLDSSDNLYRRIAFDCDEPTNWRAIAGRDDRGRSGIVHQYLCREGGMKPGFDDFFYQPAVSVVVGWSDNPAEPNFKGGTIEGILTQAGDDYKIVASQPFAGLEPLAKPDPNDLPNNHLAYAGQWFFFALTALIIYGFALRSRARKSV